MRAGRQTIALLALLLLATAACSAQNTSNNGTSGSTPTPSVRESLVEPPQTPFGSPINKEFSKVNVPAPPVAARKAGCVRPIGPGEEAPQIDYNKTFIVALVDPDRSFGASCATMAPGSDCWIPFQGGWQLKESPTGSIVFQVFENDGTQPVRSPEVGPVPSGGRFNDSTKLHYVVGRNARSVTFRAILKDAVGRVAAQSTPQTIKIPACFSSER